MATRKRPAPRSAARRPKTAAPSLTRHAPRQDRGQKRYEDVLDAAEAVIADVGVAAMTTNAVAERAGAGMGSLYRFFANKDAIVAALAERYMKAMAPLTSYAEWPGLATMPLADLADAIVDPLAGFFERTPAYGHVFHAVHQPGRRNPGCDALRDSVVHHVDSMMAARVPSTDPGRRHVLAVVGVELVHSMLDAAFDGPEADRKPLIDETKRLLALFAEMIEKDDEPLVRLRGR